jgi:hypothetical protein
VVFSAEEAQLTEHLDEGIGLVVPGVLWKASWVPPPLDAVAVPRPSRPLETGRKGGGLLPSL